VQPNTIFVGIDVGRYFHAFCAVDHQGQVVWQRKRIGNTTAAISRTLQQLRRFAGDHPLCFATEEASGNAAALVRLLCGDHESILLAQPLRVHRFHLALGQPHKSDPYDAEVIAQFARQNHPRLPRVRPGTPDIQALRVLSRRLDAISKDLRRCLNRLRATLAEYAPEWLVCAVFKDWSTEAALGTLERYARLSKLQRTPVGRLANALHRWTRGRWGKHEARTLLDALAQLRLPAVLEDAYVEAILSLVRQIRTLLAEKARLLQLIQEQGERVPTFLAVKAEFGYGTETAATIASEVGDMADFASEPQFATYSGVTPLKRRSGISQGSSHLSRFTNKRLLRAIFQATVSTVRRDERSQTYYHKKLSGKTDPRSKTRALLSLSRHRVRRLYKVLRAASDLTSAHSPQMAPHPTP